MKQGYYYSDVNSYHIVRNKIFWAPYRTSHRLIVILGISGCRFFFFLFNHGGGIVLSNRFNKNKVKMILMIKRVPFGILEKIKTNV